MHASPTRPAVPPFWLPLAAGLPITLCMAVMALPELGHAYAGAYRAFFAVAYLFWIVPLSALQRRLWQRRTSAWATVGVLSVATYVPSVINNGIGGLAALHLGLVPSLPLQRIFTGLDGCWLALIAFCAIHALVLHYTELQHSRLREAEAARFAREAQLRALQYQLQPHFLFNTLNSISSLVAEGRGADATRMLARLGDLLRDSLERSDAREVTLAEELSTTEHYLDIEKARLGRRLKVDTRIGAGVLHALLPPLLLQPLVENAIRHGIAPRVEGGTLALQVERQDDWLSIDLRNDGVAPSDAHGERNGRSGALGLNNVRQRLLALYPEAHDFQLHLADDGSCRVSIRLPLRLAPPSRGAEALSA
ncbi:sensor histidine kinase [Dyella sp. 2RAB6]|uniref:sensor histidine kinase n=1 Tax=Dyella sp. 2RAB6 TaxID=3232992 RepID=UPI003F93D869